MSSETSTVFVAVRIRPFSKKEDPLTCTLLVPDDTTVTVVDIPSLLQPAASSSNMGGSDGTSNNNNNNTSNNSGAPLNRTMSLAAGGGGGGGLGDGGPPKHSYSFDKIFWSVQPHLLPLSMGYLMETASGASSAGGGGGGKGNDQLHFSRSTSVASHGMTSVSEESAVSLGKRRSSVAAGGGRSDNTARQGSSGDGLTVQQQQQVLASAAMSLHLPCACAQPNYDDQQSMYEFLGPMIYKSVLNGFNACLFAYGQTGSGKSYSMMGPQEKLATVRAAESVGGELGIIPRLCADLFRLMREERERDESVTFSVEVSFLEIYCEKVRDLLAPSSSSSSSSSLRVRQHPTSGPYVEGLQRTKVHDAGGVLHAMVAGLRERATAETKMNLHSSRSHAILQLHIAKVSVSGDADGDGVITRTRSCKVNLVDLAGSERVSQSGVSGQSFEEAKNINLSLSTLGRVIQVLSEKQAGKKVIPAYRESVLTWLLSDCLGGNSKTIMLATIAPSAYCYHQTLNTLRFAGVAKKVVNVATVNEDRHYQQIVADLRQQIVRLTLQLEGGKAAEAHQEEMRRLRAELEEANVENDALRLRVSSGGVCGGGGDGGDSEEVAALRQRLEEAEAENRRLHADKLGLQKRLLSTSSQLREELAQRRAEILQLHETVSKKEAEVAEWAARYRTAAARPSAAAAAPVVIASPRRATGDTSDAHGGGRSPVTVISPRNTNTNISTTSDGDGAAAAGAAAAAAAAAALNQQSLEISALKKKLQKAQQEGAAARRAEQDAKDHLAALQPQIDDYKRRCEDAARLQAQMQERAATAAALLERTQQELHAYTAQYANEAERARAAETAREATAAAQMEQVRQDYLSEKQTNVQLLMRVSQVEQERSQLRKDLSEKQADLIELELMMLEETETSERYYLRTRYHRTISEVQRQFIRSLAYTHAHGEQVRRASAPLAILSPTAGDSFGSSSPLFTGRSNASGPPVPSPGSARHDPLALSQSSQQAQAQQMELLYAQLEYECLCEEQQARAQLVEGYLEGALRLAGQQGRLRQSLAARAVEGLQEALERAAVLEDELAFHRGRAEAVEADLAQQLARQTSTQEALRQSEQERLRLARRLRALEESEEEAGRANEALIAKVAEAQSKNEELLERCEAAEQMVAEAMESYYAAAASPVSGAASEAGGASSTAAAGAGGDSVRGAHQAMQALLAERRSIQSQCDTLRAELSSLSALLDTANQARTAQREEHQREVEGLQQQLRQLRAERAQQQQQHRDGGASKEYEARLQQQQEMVSTLRRALEEETAMADRCREDAQRAEAARHALEEDLLAVREACGDLKAQHKLAESRHRSLQKELDQMREEYSLLERQLLELRKREPELYLTLDRGASEDSTAWLEKAKRERANLQRQKLEARRMNTELLEHVRRRNNHLRDVQRQISELGDLSLSTGVQSLEESLMMSAESQQRYAGLASRSTSHVTAAVAATPQHAMPSAVNLSENESLPSSIPSGFVSPQNATEEEGGAPQRSHVIF